MTQFKVGSSEAEFEQAIADLKREYEDDRRDEFTIKAATDKVMKLYTDGHDYRWNYVSKTLTFYCCCGAKWEGGLLAMLLQGWRPVGDANHWCPKCIKAFRMLGGGDE
jgi:hypothetical protein